jgi:hypothetical protein
LAPHAVCQPVNPQCVNPRIGQGNFDPGSGGWVEPLGGLQILAQQAPKAPGPPSCGRKRSGHRPIMDAAEPILAYPNGSHSRRIVARTSRFKPSLSGLLGCAKRPSVEQVGIQDR